MKDVLNLNLVEHNQVLESEVKLVQALVRRRVQGWRGAGQTSGLRSPRASSRSLPTRKSAGDPSRWPRQLSSTFSPSTRGLTLRPQQTGRIVPMAKAGTVPCGVDRQTSVSIKCWSYFSPTHGQCWAQVLCHLFSEKTCFAGGRPQPPLCPLRLHSWWACSSLARSHAVLGCCHSAATLCTQTCSPPSSTCICTCCFAVAVT